MHTTYHTQNLYPGSTFMLQEILEPFFFKLTRARTQIPINAAGCSTATVNGLSTKLSTKWLSSPRLVLNDVVILNKCVPPPRNYCFFPFTAFPAKITFDAHACC